MVLIVSQGLPSTYTCSHSGCLSAFGDHIRSLAGGMAIAQIVSGMTTQFIVHLGIRMLQFVNLG